MESWRWPWSFIQKCSYFSLHNLISICSRVGMNHKKERKKERKLYDENELMNEYISTIIYNTIQLQFLLCHASSFAQPTLAYTKPPQSELCDLLRIKTLIFILFFLNILPFWIDGSIGGSVGNGDVERKTTGTKDKQNDVFHINTEQVFRGHMCWCLSLYIMWLLIHCAVKFPLFICKDIAYRTNTAGSLSHCYRSNLIWRLWGYGLLL